MPSDGVVKPVVAPKKLVADHESRRAEYSKLACCVCGGSIARANLIRGCAFDYSLGVLADLTQTGTIVALASRFIVLCKPTAISGARIIRAPTFFSADHCDAIGKVEVLQRLGRVRPVWQAMSLCAALEVAPHIGELERFIAR